MQRELIHEKHAARTERVHHNAEADFEHACLLHRRHVPEPLQGLEVRFTILITIYKNAETGVSVLHKALIALYRSETLGS